jgi:Tfp pilus assembly protein PilV
MKKGFTLIELIISVVIVIVVVASVIATLGGSCNGAASSYGRNLKQESIENSGWNVKYHWTDTETGEHFYSYSRDGGTLYPE